MYSLGLRRWYRELTSEVILSTVLGQRVKVQQGEGTDLFNQLDAVLRILARSRGHIPFFLLSGGMYICNQSCSLITPIKYYNFLRTVASSHFDGTI